MEMDGGRVFTSVGQQQQQQQHQQQYSSGSVGTLVGSSRVGCTDVSTRSTNEAVKKIVKRPYKKFYSNATPSSHCHVCARTSKAVKFAVCARISEGLCRKVTCYKCFAKFGWDWEAAVNNKSWVCVHCRGVCPEGRSQCYIYTRVNSKRESKRGVKKVGKGKGKGKQTDFSGSVSQSNSAVGGLPSISSLEAQGMTSISRHNQHDVGVPGGAVFRMG